MNEHINEFLTNLLPLYIKIEQKIREEIYKVKIIDENLPINCQKFKNRRRSSIKNYCVYDENQRVLNIEDNDTIFKNYIKKIEKKFEINEGGFIMRNDYNKNFFQK